jgi:hypothetical protein
LRDPTASATTSRLSAKTGGHPPPSAGTGGATQAVRGPFGSVPLGQAAHTTVPGCAATVPVGQTLHAGDAGMPAKVPGAQAEQLAEPGGEKLPAGQAVVQVDAPDWGWKKPAVHCWHMTIPSLFENVPG